MTKTHQLNKGAMKVHLAHQRNSRTATAAHAAAKGRACQACDGLKRKHTCGRARTSRPAAPHAAGATASRLGSEAAAAAVGRDIRMHIIAQGDEAAQGFFDPEQCARNARAAAAADRAAAKFVAAEPAVEPAVSSPRRAAAAVGAAAQLLTSPVRALFRATWQAATVVSPLRMITRSRAPATANADDFADVGDEEGGDAGAPDAAADDDGDAEGRATIDARRLEQQYARLAEHASHVPRAVSATMAAMRDSMNRGGPLPDWARRGFGFTLPPPLAFDEHGVPLEPEPEEWAGQGRMVTLLNLAKQRPVINGGHVTCPLCGGSSKPRGYSFALGDRTGITPVLGADGSWHYSASMQRVCCDKACCGATFFDSDALMQLPPGARSSLPYSPEMATGDVFLSKELAADIVNGMSKGLGAKTIAETINVKSATRYDESLEAYLEHGEVWWQHLAATVNDEQWASASDDEKLIRATQRATYVQRRGAPNKLKPYPPFDKLYGVLSPDIVLDAMKRLFATRHVSCCVELQNTSTTRLAMDDSMWVAKLVKMGAITVVTNQYGEAASIQFLTSKGQFHEKRDMLNELGARALRRHDPILVLSTDDCPNNTLEYKQLLGARHHTLDALHAMRRPTAEANNFGFHYAELCHSISMDMFYYCSADEDLIDGKLMQGLIKGKVNGRVVHGTGAESDKFSAVEILDMKTVEFDSKGKKIGGIYYKHFSQSVRRYLRSPSVIADKLAITKLRIKAMDTKRDREVHAHRRTITPEVEDAIDRLIGNTPHLYDVGDPYIPTGIGAYGLPIYIAARGTNFTEAINSIFPLIFARSSYVGLPLAVALILSAITVFNTDRRRACGLELDYTHYDRSLIERINRLSARVMGHELYAGAKPHERLRALLPDSGARFVADVDYSQYQPLARLRSRNTVRLGKRRAAAAAAADADAAADDEADAASDEADEADALDGAAALAASSALDPGSTAAAAAADNDSTRQAAQASVEASQAPQEFPPNPGSHQTAKPQPASGESASANAAASGASGSGSTAAAAAAAAGQLKAQVQLRCQAANVSKGQAANAKQAYVQARKANKHLVCSAACKLHKADHERRHAHKKCPARGFHHLASCPVRIAAESARRQGLN